MTGKILFSCWLAFVFLIPIFFVPQATLAYCPIRYQPGNTVSCYLQSDPLCFWYSAVCQREWCEDSLGLRRAASRCYNAGVRMSRAP